MDRRTFLAGGGTLLAALGCGPNPSAYQRQQTKPPTEEELERVQKMFAQQYREAAESAAKDFPFELIAVSGNEALAAFDRLRSERRGSPVILGGDEGLARVYDQLAMPAFFGGSANAKDILAKAKDLVHPQDLRLRIAEDNKKAAANIGDWAEKIPDDQLPKMIVDGRRLSPDEVRKKMQAEFQSGTYLPELGDWPAEGDRYELLSMIQDYLTGKLPDRVHLAVVPTADWTEIPAYLRWGGWNACPHPEYHVAAFRFWRDRYGAELVTMAGDVVELRISRKPQSRDEALALAKELYLYNNDLVDQGYQALAPLAASLLVSDAWGFWWD